MASLVTSGTTTLAALGVEETIINANATAGLLMFGINIGNVANGESIRIRIKPKLLTGSTAVSLYDRTYRNARGSLPLVYSGYFTSLYAVTVTLTQVGGTLRAYEWGLFQLDSVQDANLVTWLGIAPLALSSQRVDTTVGAMQTDVMNATALAATAVNEIQSGLSTLTAAQVQTELGTYGALKPTTASRTLDVSAAGNAGVDWGNVENPTSANNLSGTNIATNQVVASVSGAVGSVTGNVGGNVAGSVGSVTAGVTVTTNNDKTGYSLSAAAIAAIWAALTSALTTVGSIGKLLVDNIDATISSRLASGSYTAPPTAVQNRQEMDTNSTKLANLDATVSSRLASASYTTPPTAIQNRQEMDSNSTKLANLDAAVSTRATPAQVNTEVVDALATDTYVQPGQATPPATTTLAIMLSYIYKAVRNRNTQSSTQYSLYNDDTVTVDQKATTSDNGTTFDRGELTSGP